MLSASPIRGSGDYYLDIAKEDYYLGNEASAGRWTGGGAAALGLAGKTVERDEMSSLISGFHPSGSGAKLVFNAGKEGRQKGHDLTFSAPKSVSLLWALAGSELQKTLDEFQTKAVNAAIEYLESEAVFTRRGKSGSFAEKAKPVVAVFRHDSSRALDPQLHDHCLFLNVCVRDDGTTGTLFGRVKRAQDGTVIETINPLYRHKLSAGSVYRLELARQISELGFSTVPSKNGFGFEIEGFTDQQLKFFSKRRLEIVSELSQKGFSTAKAAEKVALDTRKTKLAIDHASLKSKWEREFLEIELSIKDIPRTPGQCGDRLSQGELIDTIRSEAKQLTDDNGVVERKELLATVADKLCHRNLAIQELSAAIDTELATGQYVLISSDETTRRYTTKENYLLETSFLKTIDGNLKGTFRGVEREKIDSVLRKHNLIPGSTKLSDEQQMAVRYLTEKRLRSGSPYRVLEGDAGSGKTTVLGVAAKVWRKAGYEVVGASLSGKAALELQQRAKIRSYSIEKWLYEWSNKKPNMLKKHGKGLIDAALKKKRIKKTTPSFKLTNKSVLVIDEAAMADTGRLNRLLHHAKKANAQVVLVGDEKQCQAIDHGGAFSAAKRALGSFRLTENWRQKLAKDQEVGELFAQGKAAEALNNLANRNRLVIRDCELQLMKTLVDDWVKQGRHSPKDNLILVATHERRQQLNELCQIRRTSALKRKIGQAIKNFEGQRLMLRDRVHFREGLSVRSGNRLIKIPNSSFGQIVGISARRKLIKVRLDSGSVVDVPMQVKTHRSERKSSGVGKYRQPKIALGYAVTTHASQGATCDNAFVLAGGTMQDRELTYVQATRAKHITKFYTTQSEAQACLDDIDRNGIRKTGAPSVNVLRFRHLVRQMSQSKRKIFAIELGEENVLERQLNMQRED